MNESVGEKHIVICFVCLSGSTFPVWATGPRSPNTWYFADLSSSRSKNGDIVDHRALYNGDNVRRLIEAVVEIRRIQRMTPLGLWGKAGIPEFVCTHHDIDEIED